MRYMPAFWTSPGTIPEPGCRTHPKQLKFIRSGVADVVVVDEQCENRYPEEARKNKACVIATTDKICLGLPDMTHADRI